MIRPGLREQVSASLRPHMSASQRIVLAFSGGLDSCVLLDILSSIDLKPNLLVWHVNHGLLDCAADMESFCQQQARQYDTACTLSHLYLDNQQSNLESVARQARYNLFEQGLNCDDLLLTAHHADDQAETFLLNLMRGSGVAGLRGIAQSKLLGKTRMLRPLLNITRETLEIFASEAELEWFEDPSNKSVRFDRNYLRHKVLPLLKQRWPGYLKAIGRSSIIQAETQALLDEIAEQDYQLSLIDSHCLDQKALTGLSRARQKHVLRYWLRQNLCKTLPNGQLEELLKQLAANEQAQPLIQTSSYDIRIFNQRIYLVMQSESSKFNREYNLKGDQSLNIGGICINRQSVVERLRLKDDGQMVIIRFRQSGKPAPEIKHRLKRLFQKYKIPPWQRDHTPQIFIDGKLTDLWLN